ncbi:hypothetical protein [Streptomyces sp. NPDC058739]|uniref:hypothetical protein n=1 Tax=Streptomyces sp. NPDC058739 TaxID=3346618 RepID=UPI003685C115
MNVISALVRRWAMEGQAFVLDGFAWQPVCGVLLVVAVVGVVAERSRRKTLVAVTTQSPPGTLVAQERGMTGSRMWIEVGAGAHELPESES